MRALLPLLALGVSSLLVAAETSGEIGWRGVTETAAPQRGATADMSNAPRVDVDRPKPFFMLHERDRRVHGLKPFQPLVDAAPAGSVLKPAPGIYAGPVRVDKPLTIDGGGQVTIDAGDKGTVFELRADGAVLTGLRLTGSGESHDTDDSCLDVRGHHNRIENLVIDNCL